MVTRIRLEGQGTSVRELETDFAAALKIMGPLNPAVTHIVYEGGLDGSFKGRMVLAINTPSQEEPSG
jgi:hypothetical protein